MRFKIIFITFLIFCFSANAKEYTWKVLEVVDGDTLKVDVPQLPTELKISVRVFGIDTPEKGHRSKCKKEDLLAKKASEITTRLVRESNTITFSDLKWDKYGGRVLAKVNIDGKDLSKTLINFKVARPYFGDKKQSWCD